MDTFFALEIFSTFFLTGLIWTVQLVHYPSFLFVADSNYKSFQTFHMRKITYIVAPMMLLELLLSAMNLYRYQSESFVIGFIIVSLIWINTILWNIPLHKKLLQKKELPIIRKLIVANWPRTILWTLKSLLLLYFLR